MNLRNIRVMGSPNGWVRETKRRIKGGIGPLLRRTRDSRQDLPRELWNLELDEAGLAIGGVDLHALLQRHGSPSHVVQGAMLKANLQRFTRVPDGLAQGCEVFCSYKTNPISGVLKFLHGLGAGAEVISPYELWLAFRLGVPPERIIYNGSAKDEPSLRHAVGREILAINANSFEELQLLEQIAQSLNKPAQIGIRICIDGGWTGQFGLRLDNGDALAAFRYAHASKWLDVVALHTHRGALIHRVEEIGALVDTALGFYETLHRELNLTLAMIDFGGSLACPSIRTLTPKDKRLAITFLCEPYAPDPLACVTIDDYVKCILKRTAAFVERIGVSMPRVIIEPGRSLTANTQMLLTRVVATKETREGFIYAVLDAGIHHAESIPHDFHQLFSVNRATAPADTLYRLVGPICSPGDVLYPVWRLPRLVPGDSLAIMDAGAYFVPSSSSFSFPKAGVVMLDDEGETCLRAVESFPEMMAQGGHE